MKITNSGTGDGRPTVAEAAGAPPVLRQDPGDAVPGRSLALLAIAEVLARRDAGAVLLDVREPSEFTAAMCADRSASACGDASKNALARCCRPTGMSC